MKLNTLAFPLFYSMMACSIAQAAVTVNTHTFLGVTDNTPGGGTNSFNVDTTGLASWGYINVQGSTSGSATGIFDSNLGGIGNSFNNTDFGSLIRDNGDSISTDGGSSPSMFVTLTEGTAGTDTVGSQGGTPNYTFDGNTAYGQYGGFAPSEKNIWQMTFNDLGVGEFLITLYMGHSQTNRLFDMDVTGTGITPFTTSSPQIGTLGSNVAAYGTSGAAFTYNISVTTTDATDDLTLTFDGNGGSFGGAVLAGYTVFAPPAPVPEASSVALLGLGSILLIARRRRA